MRTFLYAWTLIIALPFVSMILLSFHSTVTIFTRPVGLSGAWIPGNYSDAWQGPPGGVPLSLSFVNSLLTGSIAIVLAVGFGVSSGFFMTYLHPRAQRRLQRLALGVIILPLVVLLVPLFNLVDAVGGLNQPTVVGVVYGGLAYPTVLLIAYAFYVNFPRPILEAAEIDGLGMVGAFFRVVAPVSRGVIGTASLLVLIFSWGEAQIGTVLLQEPSARTLAVSVLGFEGEYLTNYGPLFAALVLAAAPTIVVYLLSNRYIRSGISLGGSLR